MKRMMILTAILILNNSCWAHERQPHYRQSLNVCIEDVSRYTEVPQGVVFSILRYEENPYTKLPPLERLRDNCKKAKYIGSILSIDLKRGYTLRQAVHRFGGSSEKFTQRVMQEAIEFEYKY